MPLLASLVTDWFRPLLAADTPAPPPRRPWSEAAFAWPERGAKWLHQFVPGIDEALFRWLVCLGVIALTLLVRRALTRFILAQVKRLSGKSETGVRDKLLASLLTPLAALFMVAGIFAALAVLTLSERGEAIAATAARAAVIAVVLWGLMNVGAAWLDQAERSARARGTGIGAFMPLLKKTLAVVYVLLSVLIVAKSLGADVTTFLGTLGIGGLAVALAAQDTIANMFGSFVVVMDQPFRVGDAVKIAGNEGTVEDIGLRSTRLRTAARTLIVIPNKTVASEAITNYSRMPQRRVDQAIGLTYDTSPEQMAGILADLRAVLLQDPGVHKSLISVHFTEYAESSLVIEIVYFTVDPDWLTHLDVRERVNLKIMRSVAARGLAFAFPTQTVIHETPDPPALESPPPR